MDSIIHLLLKIAKKLYQFCCISKPKKGYVKPTEIGLSAEQTSELISSLIDSKAPCMIARFGSTELSTVLNCKAVEGKLVNPIKYIRGQQSQWWWNDSLIQQMEQWSGFFPSTRESVSRFAEYLSSATLDIDVLARWTREDLQFELPVDIRFIHLIYFEPYWSKTPWTKSLEGKKVLVIHPYAELIEQQYHTKRSLLFDNPNVLPEFELKTIKAVQSLGGTSVFSNWFEALEWMEKEIDKADFDVCLIGCGAYGFILASYIKRIGKKAIHLGGALQLLFGIKGKRWENPDYVKSWNLQPYDFYKNLFSNPNWVRPTDYKPRNANSVENGCYW